MIHNWVLACPAASNAGLMQAIGMIQLMAGALNMAKKAGKGIRLYVENPETHMHPEQQCNLADLLVTLLKDYGPVEGPNESATHSNP